MRRYSVCQMLCATQIGVSFGTVIYFIFHLESEKAPEDPWDYTDVHVVMDTPQPGSRQKTQQDHLHNNLVHRGLKQTTGNSSNNTGSWIHNTPGFLDLYDLSAKTPDVISKCVRTKTEPAFYICLYEPERDKYISGSLLSTGVWEPYITPLVQKALNCTPRAIFIDIGANIGYYSMLAAAAGRSVIAVEPSKTSVDRFHKASKMNNAQDLISLCHNAISDRHQNVTLTSNRYNQGGVWIKPINDQNKEASSRRRAGSTVVRATTMDHLLDLAVLRQHTQAIIKIDIEGFECRAIAQAQRLLSSFYIPYIFMEWRQMFLLRDYKHTPCPRSYMTKMADMLTNMEYVPYEVRTGFELDSTSSAEDWKIGDVYWKHVTAHELQEPY